MVALERDLTPRDRGKAINVGTLRRLVRIIIIDGRPGNLTRRTELMGMMDIPAPLMEGLVKTNWDFDELQQPLVGTVCDARAEGCNIVFPLIGPADCRAVGGSDLSLEDLTHIFLKYNPQLKVEVVI